MNALKGVHVLQKLQFPFLSETSRSDLKFLSVVSSFESMNVQCESCMYSSSCLFRRFSLHLLPQPKNSQEFLDQITVRLEKCMSPFLSFPLVYHPSQGIHSPLILLYRQQGL